MNSFIRHHRKIMKCSCATFRLGNKLNKYSTYSYRSQTAPRQFLNYSNVNRGLTFSPCEAFLDHSTFVLCSYHAARSFHLGQSLRESPSSKVEVTVQTMKNKQKEKVEEIIKEVVSGGAASAGPAVTDVSPPPKKPTNVAKGEAAAAAAAAAVNPEAGAVAKPKAAVTKKPLKTRVWEEVLHYYHGFRLLFIDINICRKLLWRVLNGKTLTRRENKLLVRTTSDLFRLIPFSVFVIVPFMELLLPIFIKLFPGMLPSTFITAKDHEDKLKQSLQVKLEMAKFLQKTLDEMAVQHKEHKSEDAKQFAEFFRRIKDPNEYVSSDEIIKFAKRFEDEITLDSLSRDQLIALCRMLELNTMGTTNMLRFQLRVKLRSLAADDRVISREGVKSLDLFELQQACKTRGMRAYGLTSDKLRGQLQEWIDLSLNEKVPPTLLLLSRALLISDDTTTTHKLKETIRVLPESVATQTKEAIGVSEGKIDNKTKIEIIKEEERKIKEEREEEKEEQKAIEEEKKVKAEILMDKAPILDTGDTVLTPPAKLIAKPAKKIIDVPKEDLQPEKETISSKDAELLSNALKTLSKTDKKMVVEKETIKDIKEELEDYKEDVEELREVRDVVKEPVKESRAAKLLFKKVNTMIGQLDKVLVDLEKKHHEIEAKTGAAKAQPTEFEEESEKRKEELVRIDELVNTIKGLKQTSDESRLKQIETILSKMDTDKDGVISVKELRQVVEAIMRENVKLNEKQVEEILTLLDKEQLIETEDRIEKALAKSMKEVRRIEKQKAGEAAKLTEELKDLAPELKDNALDLSLDERKNVLETEVSSSTKDAPLLKSSEKQKEKMIPKSDIPATMPPTIPPPTSSGQTNPKDKML